MSHLTIGRYVRGFAAATLLGAALVPAGAAKAAGPIFVTTTVDELSINGLCSLREAINMANSNIVYADCGQGSGNDADTIFLQAGASYDLTKTTPANRDSQAGDLDIANNTAATDLFIMGAPQDPPTIRAMFAQSSPSRIFEIAGGAKVFVSYLGITGGKDEYGGGILNSGALELTDVEVFKNHGSYGGGIANKPGAELTLSAGSDIHHNRSQSYGGGIDNVSARLTVQGSSLIRANTAVYGGAGFRSAGPNKQPALATIRETSMVQGNIADGVAGGGGGVLNDEGSGLLIENSSVVQNKASAEGGGVYNAAGSSLIVRGSTLALNSARSEHAPGPAGGGVANYGTAQIDTSAIWGNTTGKAVSNVGGGVYSAGMLVIERSALYNNASGAVGGAIYSQKTLDVVNSTISNNGGKYALYSTNAPIGLYNSTVAGNHGGVALHGNAASLKLGRSILADNDTEGLPNCYTNNQAGSEGYNIIDSDCVLFAVASDKVGSDPKLQPLTNNGGPTVTLAIAGNSPARDLVPQAQCNVVKYQSQLLDQRGTKRPQDLGCDSGAYEFTLGIAAAAPKPALTTISPHNAAAGEGNKLVNVIGSNFSPTSEVLWDGQARKTTIMGKNFLLVELTAQDLAKPGEHVISVRTPPPGGGTSNGFFFMVLGK